MIDIRARIPSGHTGRFTIPNLEEVEGIAVHHSVSGWAWQPETQKYTCHWNDAIDVAPEVEAAHLLAIDRWHSAPNNDWGGFGYHLAAFPSGRWYYVGSLNTARAHVVGLNNRFMGLVVIGDYSKAVPCQGALEAAKEGVAFIREFYQRTLVVEPHRLIRNQATRCPGELYHKWVPQLNVAEEPVVINDDFAALRATEMGFMAAADAAHCLTLGQQIQTISSIPHNEGESKDKEMMNWERLRRKYEAEIDAIKKALERCTWMGRGD